MRRHWLISIAIPAVFAAGPASSAGYGLKEYSADAMAGAYAGAAATGTDATYLAYNPASAAEVATTDFAINLIGIFPTSEANYTTANNALTLPISGSRKPSSFIDDAVVPSLGVRTRIDEKWTAGVVVFVPWGLATHYPDDWAGRYHAQQSKVITIDTVPTIAYQLTPEIVLAAGMQIQYAKGVLSNAIDIGTIGLLNSIPGGGDGKVKFTADDWAYGFTLGATFKPNPDTTLGISYRSQIEHDFDGPVKFRLDNAGVGAIINGATGLFDNTDASAQLTTPDVVSAGARIKLNEQWIGLLEVDWTNWEDFKELRVKFQNPAQPDDVTVFDWDNTWYGSIGAEYHPNETWMFKTGIGYDQSPVPNSTRNPRVPDADRVWLSAGIGFRASDQVWIKLAAEHLFIGDERVNLTSAMPGNALRGDLRGTTDSEVNTLALELTFTP